MAKVAKPAALYRDHPKGADHCALCTMFRPPSGCTTVAGRILPRGWCKYFKRKKTS